MVEEVAVRLPTPANRPDTIGAALQVCAPAYHSTLHDLRDKPLLCEVERHCLAVYHYQYHPKLLVNLGASLPLGARGAFQV